MNCLTVSAFIMSAASVAVLGVMYSTVVPKVNGVLEKVDAFSSLPSMPSDPGGFSFPTRAF